MEYTDLIHTRESIRNYDPEKQVPKEILEKILDVGRLAPSACNFQPWKFILVTSKAILERVKACYNREWLQGAPHILIVLGIRSQAWNRKNGGPGDIRDDTDGVSETRIQKDVS